jgi:hypothetical protein
MVEIPEHDPTNTGVRMRVSPRNTILAATALTAAAVLFAGGTSAMADFVGTATGTGTTLAAAEEQASAAIAGNYSGCIRPFYLDGDGQYANGTWWATESASCRGDN